LFFDVDTGVIELQVLNLDSDDYKCAYFRFIFVLEIVVIRYHFIALPKSLIQLGLVFGTKPLSLRKKSMDVIVHLSKLLCNTSIKNDFYRTN